MSSYWSGIALPWGPTIPSVIEPKGDAEIIKSSVEWIVLTAIGERVMDPEFGSMVPLMLFEQNDVDSVNAMKESVKDAIKKYEDRVEFVDFTAEASDNTLVCKLSYKFATDPLHDSSTTVEFTLTEGMLTSL